MRAADLRHRLVAIRRLQPGTWRWAPDRDLAAAVGAVALAIAAIAGAYLVAHARSPGLTSATRVVAEAPQVDSSPVLAGTLPESTGPEGLRGNWIGNAASIDLEGIGATWLGFRAASPSAARVIRMRGSDGEEITIRVGRRSSVFLVGPLAGTSLALHVAPESTAPSARAHPGSIFLSMLRAFARPIAALPGAGFWPTEHADGVTFNWLNTSGTIDLYTPNATTRGVRLTFVARSLSADRTLTAVSGRTVRQTRVGTVAQLTSLGTFPLKDGRARVLLQPSPGPTRVSPDPRALSIQVAQLTAEPTSAG